MTILAFALFASSALMAAPAKKLSAKDAALAMADRIVASTTYQFKNTETGETYTTVKKQNPAAPIKVGCKYNDWHYTNGVLHIAMLELADKLGDKRYEEYVLKNMNFVFNEGNLEFFRKKFDKALSEKGWMAVRKISWHMIFRGKRLDDNGPMGASLIDLQKHLPRPDKAFQAYIDETADHLNYAEPRLIDGTIARLCAHYKTDWADDLIMAVSFLCRMGEATGNMKYFDDAANQVLQYHKYLWCPEKQIYYHCYHTDTDEHGVAHWSRANGWMLMAQADLLSRLPENHPQREALLENFRRQVSGVCRYQGANGLWHQLLDKTDSYDEVTGTAMFTFAIARGVKQGWIHKDFIYVAEQGLNGILSKMSAEGDLEAICVGTGIMPSLTYYYNRPTQKNDPMGEGPVLRALVEMMDAPKYTEIKAEQQYDRIVVDKN